MTTKNTAPEMKFNGSSTPVQGLGIMPFWLSFRTSIYMCIYIYTHILQHILKYIHVTYIYIYIL